MKKRQKQQGYAGWRSLPRKLGIFISIYLDRHHTYRTLKRTNAHSDTKKCTAHPTSTINKLAYSKILGVVY